jgi:hypothetical protein
MSADQQPPFCYPPPERPRIDLIDCWRFLLPFGVACGLLMVARAFGVL